MRTSRLSLIVNIPHYCDLGRTSGLRVPKLKRAKADAICLLNTRSDVSYLDVGEVLLFDAS